MLLTTGFFWVPETYGVDLAEKAAIDGAQRAARHRSRLHGDGRPDAVASLAGCSGTERRATVHHRGRASEQPAAAAPATFAEVQAIFDGQLRGSSCHLDPAGGCLAAPPAGLSLCAAEARDALVDVPSRQVGSLALVAPLDSARSYLLRKLLPATAGGRPHPRDARPAGAPGPPLSAEPDSDHRSLDRRWRAPVEIGET